MIFNKPLRFSEEWANGLRYPLVISTGSIRRGGTGSRRFDGTSFEPRNLPENAQTPTSRVHALLGGWFRLPLLRLG